MTNKSNIIYQKINFYKRLNLLGFKTYSEYLKSKHWQEKKEEYKNSDMPQYCLNCNNKNYLLHHRSYVRLGDESLFDFIPLCKNCHYKITKYLKENIIILYANSLFKKVFSYNKKEVREKMRLISKNSKSATKFKDVNKIDILSRAHREERL